MEILRPTTEHAEILAELGRATFTETFVGKAYYTHEIIGGYCDKVFVPALIRKDLTDPKIAYFLLRDDGAFIGYAKLVDRAPEPCVDVPNPLYLERLYVKQGAQGKGYGRALMDALYAEARARGKVGIWLSVWEHNLQAQAFYRKIGFKRAGEWDWPFDSQGVRYVDVDYIMTALVPPAPH